MHKYELHTTADHLGQRGCAWITRNGHPMDLGDVVTELCEMQAEIERLRVNATETEDAK